MANAALDANSTQTAIALLNTNGTTITRVQGNASNHALKVDDNSTGSDYGGTGAHFDDNGRITLFALSSAGDGTLVALYVDSSGKLLVQST